MKSVEQLIAFLSSPETDVWEELTKTVTRGRPCDGFGCVLARYLRKQSGGHHGIRVRRDSVCWAGGGGMQKEATLNSKLAVFVAEFDAGRYPELEVGG